MTARTLIALCVSLAAGVLGWLSWRHFSSRRELAERSLPTIIKQPVAFVSHTFDPASPPADMPPLSPGENAECDSDFLSNASIRGETRQMDATHATLTVTKIRMTLQLKVDIWLPVGANQHLTEHERGHRQISEYYYQTADRVAERVAAMYIGRRVEISSTDLNAESNRMLQQMATEITSEYNKELNSGPTQLLYDNITDHGRNETVAEDAIDHAIKNVVVEFAGSKNADP